MITRSFRTRKGQHWLSLMLVLIAFIGWIPTVHGEDLDTLLDRIQERGQLRVIVGMDSAVPPLHPETTLSALEVKEQRSLIFQAQAALLNRLASTHMDDVITFQTVPYMAMSVDEEGLRALFNDPVVTSVQEDIPVPPTLQDSIPLINADDAHNMGTTGAGQAVVILDTGTDRNHSFFGGRVVAEACFSTTNAIENSTTVCPDGSESQIGTDAAAPCSFDGCDHGTHVAGIATGASNDRDGVAKAADIIAIQVFSRFDSPSSCPFGPPCPRSFTSDQMQALEHVFVELRDTFDIASVNMSLGGGDFSSACDTHPLKALIDQLRDANIATVIASGNNGNKTGIAAPACISSAISVGATSKADVVADFSQSAPILDLLAPGVDITSSVPGDGFLALDGTSMAAPHVAGAIALLKQVEPLLTVTEALDALQNTGVDITDAGNGLTTPRIDVKAAINSITPDVGISSTVDFEELNEGEIIRHVASGRGISGNPIEGKIKVRGVNDKIPNENAAMIFDATCDGGCTGDPDDDLEQPELGHVLIISEEDLDSDNPNDNGGGGSLEFDFSKWGSGKVTVESIDLLDIDNNEPDGKIELFSGGKNGTLLQTIPIPTRGNNVLFTLDIGVSDVDFMRVVLDGSGAVDNIVIEGANP